MPILAGLLSAVAVVSPAPAPSAEAVVVVTGTRIERDSTDIPASISVVDLAAADGTQANVNASEALARVPGLVVQNRQNYAQDLQISSRGFGARAAFGVRGVRLLVDGIPATLPDGQGQAATFNLDAAKRIEVLRGPFSALYGNHAGGVIQLFTRDGDGPQRASLNLASGSDGMRKADFSAEGGAGNVSYLVDGSRFTTDGYRDHSAAQREQAFAKLSWMPQPGSRLTLQASTMRQPGAQDPLGVTWASFQRDPRGGEVDATDTANPKSTFAQRHDTRKDISHQQVGLAWDQRVGDGKLHLVAYGGKREVLQYQAFSRAFQAPASHSGGVVDFDRGFWGMDMHWTQGLRLDGAKVDFTVGLEIARASDARRGFENFSGTQLGIKGQLRRDEQDDQSGIDPYVQVEWKSGPWQASAGLRHSRLKFDVADRFLANGNDSGALDFVHTTPLLGLLYKASPTLSVYASAAGGVEAPTINELFYSSSGGFNFKLRAAHSTHVEAGLKLTHDSMRINAAMFQVTTRDELVVDSAIGGRTSYRNASRTLRQGAELSLDTAAGPNWQAHLAATLLRAIYTQGFGTVAAGSQIPGVPRATLFGELAWAPAAGPFGASLEVQANARVYADDANADVPAPGYALVNAAFHARQTSGNWQLRQFLRLNNLANRQYVGSVIVGDANKRYYEAAPGRNIVFGAKAQYQF
jgi:iron complex outermembrane receptor protein